jgi:hypothetical protein
MQRVSDSLATRRDALRPPAQHNTTQHPLEQSPIPTRDIVPLCFLFLMQ